MKFHTDRGKAQSLFDRSEQSKVVINPQDFTR